MQLANFAYDYRDEPTDLDLVRVLSNRYGDGTVNFPRGTPRYLQTLCIEAGYICHDGLLTTRGRKLLAQYSE